MKKSYWSKEWEEMHREPDDQARIEEAYPLNFTSDMFDHLPKSRDGRTTRADQCATIANSVFQNWYKNENKNPSPAVMKMKEALRYYADGNHLHQIKHGDGTYSFVDCGDMGTTARNVIGTGGDIAEFEKELGK